MSVVVKRQRLFVPTTSFRQVKIRLDLFESMFFLLLVVSSRPTAIIVFGPRRKEGWKDRLIWLNRFQFEPAPPARSRVFAFYWAA